jgi:hypothetical protein
MPASSRGRQIDEIDLALNVQSDKARATYPVLDPFTGSVQNLTRSLSPLDHVPAEGSPAIGRPQSFSRSTPLLHLTTGPSSSRIHPRTLQKPFNTQSLVPAPFNEFYPKCSGPTIPVHHAVAAK